MWVWVSLSLLLWCPSLWAAPPVRQNTYVAGEVISPASVMANEDVIFDYLQDGVDTYAAGSITTAALANGAVTSAKIANGTITSEDLAGSLSGNSLPVGAVFFMLTGNCPAFTTDISATYPNLFIRISATAGTLGGADTHTHTAGSLTGTAHTHTISGTTAGAADTPQESTGAGNPTPPESHTHTFSATSSSGGGGAISGTSASSDNVPAFITMKLCRVDS